MPSSCARSLWVSPLTTSSSPFFSKSVARRGRVPLRAWISSSRRNLSKLLLTKPITPCAKSGEHWIKVSIVSYEINRSEEHTSELQSLTNLVCRLLLEKKKKKT